MAVATSADSTVWSSGIAVATDTPIQCQEGQVRVTWDGTAAVGDGLILQAGQTIVVPGGITFRWAPRNSVSSTIFYESFGV